MSRRYPDVSFSLVMRASRPALLGAFLLLGCQPATIVLPAVAPNPDATIAPAQVAIAAPAETSDCNEIAPASTPIVALQRHGRYIQMLLPGEWENLTDEGAITAAFATVEAGIQNPVFACYPNHFAGAWSVYQGIKGQPPVLIAPPSSIPVCPSSPASAIATARYGAYAGAPLPQEWINELDTENHVTAEIRRLEVEVSDLAACFDKQFPAAMLVYSSIRLDEMTAPRRTPEPVLDRPLRYPNGEECDQYWAQLGVADDLKATVEKTFKDIRERVAKGQLSQNQADALMKQAEVAMDMSLGRQKTEFTRDCITGRFGMMR